ncbi:MAG TPA: sugar phosphate isomerase/epimerase family protein [Natronosporangium sp.]
MPDREQPGATGFIASTYTYLWRSELEAAVAGIAEAGFDRLELLAAPPHVDAGQLRQATDRIGTACGRSGVRVHSVVPSGVDVNLASPEPTMREWSVGYFVSIGRLAADVGARWLIIHPGRRHPLRPAPDRLYRRWVIDGVRYLLDALAPQIGVLFENTPTGVLDTGDECRWLVEQVGADRLGVCYDVANGHMVEDVAAGLAAVASSLRLVHLSDTRKAAWAHDPIGAGELDFGRVASTLAGVGYRGELVLETLHDNDPVRGFTEDLMALRRAGRWGGSTAASAP